MDAGELVRQDDDAAARAACGHGPFDIRRLTQEGHIEAKRHRRSRGLQCRQVIRAASGGRIGIAHGGDMHCAGRDLLKQFQPLATERGKIAGESGGVAVRPREGGEDAVTNTTGIVRVSRSKAPAAILLEATMTSGCKATSSLPSTRSRSASNVER